MKKRCILFWAISAASPIISVISLLIAISILGSATEIFVFSAITAVLSVLGLIGCFGRGKAAFGCFVTAGTVSAGFTLISLFYSITDGDIFVIALIYFGLYTAGAALAYKEKRNEISV